ncbi:MAG: DNA-processing protein DprA [Candidatus Binataceae bacterium]
MPASPDAYWLALREVRGVGPRIAKLLLDAFGSPERVFAAGEKAIAETGVPRHTARAIGEFREFDRLEQELCEITKLSARLVRLTDPDYPPNLKHIADPPTFLYVRGDGALAEPKCIAIVGARAASDAGRRMAQRLALELAAKGVVVVSGLARGIDAEAHQGALDAGGMTFAILGSGIDVIYPPEHRPLAEKIVQSGGALLTELRIGSPPIAENFPTRNRILAGICLGVVVVEAAERSGSLISARMALEQDRQVFAVPGSPVSGKTRGSNRLLKDGAVLVECVEDVLEELAPQLVGLGAKAGLLTAPPGTPATGPTAEREHDVEALAIINQLNHEERLHIDSIIETTGLSTSNVLRLLLDLELKGLVSQHPGKLFSLA